MNCRSQRNICQVFQKKIINYFYKLQISEKYISNCSQILEKITNYSQITVGPILSNLTPSLPFPDPRRPDGVWRSPEGPEAPSTTDTVASAKRRRRCPLLPPSPGDRMMRAPKPTDCPIAILKLKYFQLGLALKYDIIRKSGEFTHTVI